ncbi:hypothetical protein F5Y09DRAFT_342705 [Xylaria sp. FL1042]|nr:hypothetical protein F5Y09DRAFT_342705 [Xylaria sp. FL1042]
MKFSVRIAIIDGGLAGASPVHSLVKLPHPDVHIFESTAAFREASMAMRIARNTQTALGLIGPSAARYLERAGAVPMRGVQFMPARGETTGSVVIRSTLWFKEIISPTLFIAPIFCKSYSLISSRLNACVYKATKHQQK